MENTKAYRHLKSVNTYSGRKKTMKKPSLWQPVTSPRTIALIGKYFEEKNEHGSALARILIQGADEREPVTKKLNKQWLTEEIADKLTTLLIIAEHFELDVNVIDRRIATKKQFLEEWLLTLKDE